MGRAPPHSPHLLARFDHAGHDGMMMMVLSPILQNRERERAQQGTAQFGEAKGGPDTPTGPRQSCLYVIIVDRHGWPGWKDAQSKRRKKKKKKKKKKASTATLGMQGVVMMAQFSSSLERVF